MVRRKRFILVAACLLLLLSWTPLMYMRWTDYDLVARIRENVRTVELGDTKEVVLQKLGSPVKVFPPAPNTFLGRDLEEWAYGKKYDSFPNYDIFRIPHLGMRKTRPFGPIGDDFVIVFSEDGHVAELIQP